MVYDAPNEDSEHSRRVLNMGMEGTSIPSNRRVVSIYGLRVVVRADFDARLHMISDPLTFRMTVGIGRGDMRKLVGLFSDRRYTHRTLKCWESGQRKYKIGPGPAHVYARAIDAIVEALTDGTCRACVTGTRRWCVRLRRVA
jgi:hypothetical protein